MRFRKREETHRDQREVGFWMQHWPRRGEGPRSWRWQLPKAADIPPRGAAVSRLGTTDSTSGGIGSGSLGPGDVVLKVPSADPMQLPHEKPWYSLHGFLAYVARQRDKIPRRFRKTRDGVKVEGAHRSWKPSTAPPSSAPEGAVVDKSVTNGQNILANDPLQANIVRFEESVPPASHDPLPSQDCKAPPLGSYVKRPTSDGESRREMACMTGSCSKKAQPAGHSLVRVEDHQYTASEMAEDEDKIPSDSQTQGVPGPEPAHEAPRPSTHSTSTSWDAEETNHDSRPRPATKDFVDSAEFVSSAIMVQCPTGRHESVKLFYDTGCPDNLVSRKFIEKYGFKERPLLEDDLKAYKTPAGVPFVTSHYVEIELRDTEHGIEDFTKTSFNVADAMDGIGLLAGRRFMIKHAVSLSAKEGPGAYVLISKKHGSLDDKRRQKLLQDQTATAVEKAKAYTASGSGSTTTPAGTSQAQHPAASSHTSNSSGAKNNSSGK